MRLATLFHDPLGIFDLIPCNSKNAGWKLMNVEHSFIFKGYQFFIYTDLVPDEGDTLIFTQYTVEVTSGQSVLKIHRDSGAYNDFLTQELMVKQKLSNRWLDFQRRLKKSINTHGKSPTFKGLTDETH